MKDLNQISGKVIGAAIEVHKQLGPGLLESSYETCLVYELELGGLQIERQKTLPIVYKDLLLEQGYRIDLIVEKAIVVEIKAVEALLPVHQAQILTYLRLSNLHLGLLINFNVPKLKEGIRRFII